VEYAVYQPSLFGRWHDTKAEMGDRAGRLVVRVIRPSHSPNDTGPCPARRVVADSLIVMEYGPGTMPELPEVEITRCGLRPVLEGRILSKVEVHTRFLRYPLPRGFSARLRGRRIERLSRRGKVLLAFLDDDKIWLTHLGMSGRMTVLTGSTEPRDKHDHLIFVTDRGHEIRFNDARRFGFMDLIVGGRVAGNKHLKFLGMEPLTDCLTAASLSAALNGKRCTIKAALMDQRVVAGLGNIYVCEALYWAGISPRCNAGKITGARSERLVSAIKEVLTTAIAAGGSSLRDFRHTDGDLGYFQTKFSVYGREGKPCPRCIGKCSIRRFVQHGRSTFYCAKFQR